MESFPGGAAGQTLPVIVETMAFTSELTVTNVSATAKVVNFTFVADGIQTTDHTVRVPAPLAAGQQLVIPELVDEVRRRGLAGIGPTRGGLAGPLFATVADGNMEGIVVGARTVTPAVFAGGQYGVFYNAAPYGSAFSQVAWVEGLQQNQESRSNLALVNTGEVDDSQSVFAIDIYDGDTGLPVRTITGITVPARGWRQDQQHSARLCPGHHPGICPHPQDLRLQSLPGLRGDQRRRQPRGTERRRRLYPGPGVGRHFSPMAGNVGSQSTKGQERQKYPRRGTKDKKIPDYA